MLVYTQELAILRFLVSPGREGPSIHAGKLLRGHVNKKKFQKSKKTLEVGGWVKCPIGNKKKLENIFLYIILLRFWASI